MCTLQPVQVLGKRARDLGEQLAACERDAGGNRTELEARLMEAETECRTRHDVLANVSSVAAGLRTCVDERLERYGELFDTVTRTVSQKFMSYMHRRGHQVCRTTTAALLHCNSTHFTLWPASLFGNGSVWDAHVRRAGSRSLKKTASSSCW